MSKLPKFTIKGLIDAGVHYGHKTMRWNPKMSPYLYGSRKGVHIIDLQQTAPLLQRSLKIVYDVVKNNGRILFVATKRQASDVVAEYAKRCGQYYVNNRWLGGMLTNWNTVSASIKTLKQLEERLSGSLEGLKKKEILALQRKADKLRKSLGGIMDMGGKPDLLFVIDTNKESLALNEARKLGVPVIAILDSNSDPDNIDFPIPGNDDAVKSIDLYCKLISDAALGGIQEGLSNSGVDVGEFEGDPVAALAKLAENEKDKRSKPKGKSSAKNTRKPADKKDTKSTKEKAASAKKEEKPAKAAKEKAEEADKAPAKKAKKVEEKPAKEKADGKVKEATK